MKVPLCRSCESLMGLGDVRPQGCRACTLLLTFAAAAGVGYWAFTKLAAK